MGFNMEKPFCKVISGLTWMETVTNNLLKMANVHVCHYRYNKWVSMS